jgi:hypothetical protein
MGIEQTMQFITDNLAAVTAAQQQAEVRAARTDRQIHGLQTLVKIGMRRLVKLEERSLSSQKRTDARFAELAISQKHANEALRDLAASQKRTDQKFDRWLNSLKGGNGKRY